VLCRVLQVSTSAFYAWAQATENTDKIKKKEALEAKARELFEENKNVYCSRRLADALMKAGMEAGRYKVRRLMARLGLEVRYPKRYKVTTDSNHSEAIAPNILDRQFAVAEPNKVWTTDITYVWTPEGWLYVAIVIDLFSRQVVAGQWLIICEHHCASVPCKWPFGGENPSLACFIIPIEAVNMPVRNTGDTWLS
jgi:putative transposase